MSDHDDPQMSIGVNRQSSESSIQVAPMQVSITQPGPSTNAIATAPISSDDEPPDISVTTPVRPSGHGASAKDNAYQALPLILQLLGDRLGDCVTTAITTSMSAQTEAVIKNIIEALPSGNRRSTSGKADRDADGEEEIIATLARKRRSSGRKPTGPKGPTNRFNVSDCWIFKCSHVNAEGYRPLSVPFYEVKVCCPQQVTHSRLKSPPMSLAHSCETVTRFRTSRTFS